MEQANETLNRLNNLLKTLQTQAPKDVWKQPNSISDLMAMYSAALKSIQGGHSCIIFEYNHRNTTGVNITPAQEDFESNIPWLDLNKVPEKYNIQCIWQTISLETFQAHIAQRMEAAWAFQKLFGTHNSSAFPEIIEQEMVELIAKTKQTLKDYASVLTVYQTLYLNLGGNDYWAFVASSVSESFTFEIMHFID